MTEHTATPTTIAIASGKGGVGKSFFALNTAWCLAELGQRVLIVEMDVDAGSLSLASGLGEMPTTPAATTPQSLAMRVLTLPGSNNVHLLRGVDIPTAWQSAPSTLEPILKAIALPLRVQWILFDLAPGMSRSTVLWLSSVQMPMLIGTPELVCIQAMMRLHKQTKYQHAYEQLLLNEPSLRNNPPSPPSLKVAKQKLFALHDQDTAQHIWSQALQSWKVSQWVFNRTLPDDEAQLHRIHAYIKHQVGHTNVLTLPEDLAQTKCARYGRILLRYEPHATSANVIREFGAALIQQRTQPIAIESTDVAAA